MLSTEPDRISVAVGIIFDSQNRVLIGKRRPPCAYAGYWEFPGGKIMPFESDAEALKRELQEEIGILVHESLPFTKFAYDYADRKVMLHFHLVFEYEGTPRPLEEQTIQWAAISVLPEIGMLAPNVKVIESLQLKFS